jgi:glycosyltransferase involved in cell wall biosynthesis/CDP-glycerol glycerophosphotransferase (TagB/SpsB family)
MRPQFSVVTAIYDVAPYIEAYLSSLDRQTYGVAHLEVVLVDDGSTDGSAEIAERWGRTSAASVRVLRQENAGQGAARNAGMKVATGQWVTFPDPDDVLAETYFAEIAAFLAAQSQVPDLLAGRLLTFADDHTEHVDHHPLRGNFKGKNQLVDLSRFPNRVHLSGASSFLLLDRVRENGVEFDSRIRPTFEDGHLIGVYLLSSAAPLVGFVRTAEYYYRKRVDGTSSVQSGWARDEKYTNVPRHGFLDLLRRAKAAHGQVPLWVQNTVLYDLLWYFKTDFRLGAPTGAISPEVLDEFHDLCRDILTHIDVETILGFEIHKADHWLRSALIAGYKNPSLRPDYVTLDSLDDRQRLVRVRYLFSGERPDEAFYWRGRAVAPVHEKVRAVKLLGRTLANERIVWLPADGTVWIALDGRPVPLSTRGPIDLPYALTPDRLWRSLGVRRREGDGTHRAGRRARLVHLLRAPQRRVAAVRTWLRGWVDGEQWTARMSKRLARSAWARNRYSDAWVLVDRQEQAKDNAEHLYRYLKAKRPNVNAWFVLDRDSEDWNRLAREGFRLVPYGSWRWRALLLNARHVLSSHVNAYVTNPLPRRLYGGPGWRFTFLQHGVTKDDISRWLNPKRIHLVATVTDAETASFTADGTPYFFTGREIKQTGFPRHDSLLSLAKRLSPEQVDQILIMPTWRRSLTDLLPETMSPEERAEAFRSSDYGRHWLAVLQSPELEQIARRTGRRLVLLPHPHPGMADYLMSAGLPSYIEVLSWKRLDVQDVLARSAMLITDYTSVAFDMAILGRPVAYYQFDRDQFFSSGHLFRRGYFDYDRDGFGPVARSHEVLITALEKLAADDFVPSDAVAGRIEHTLGERDGNACYRVFKAVSQLDRPVRPRTVDGSESAVLPADTSADDIQPDAVLATEYTAEDDAEIVRAAVGVAALGGASPVIGEDER